MQVDYISSLEIMRPQHEFVLGPHACISGGGAHSFNPFVIEMIVHFRFATGIQF